MFVEMDEDKDICFKIIRGKIIGGLEVGWEGKEMFVLCAK